MGLTRQALTELGWDEPSIGQWIAEVPDIEVEDAVGWRGLGVGPETAAWYGGVRPSIADEWLAHGFAVDEMVRCHRSRVTLARALQWRADGRSLDDTILWGGHGFSSAEADEWTTAGHDVRTAHAIRVAAGNEDAAGAWVMRTNAGASLREPIDVPDEARDREAELAEMSPHLHDRESLGESVGGGAASSAHLTGSTSAVPMWVIPGVLVKAGWWAGPSP